MTTVIALSLTKQNTAVSIGSFAVTHGAAVMAQSYIHLFVGVTSRHGGRESGTSNEEIFGFGMWKKPYRLGWKKAGITSVINTHVTGYEYELSILFGISAFLSDDGSFDRWEQSIIDPLRGVLYDPKTWNSEIPDYWSCWSRL
jgi:hypothetical protein